MNIKEKLANVTANAASEIIAYKEGVFYRFYNESLYLCNQYLQENESKALKVTLKTYKSAEGECVSVGGMPESSFKARFKEAFIREGYYVIPCSIGIEGYAKWKSHQQTAKEDENAKLQVVNDDNKRDCYQHHWILLSNALIEKVLVTEYLTASPYEFMELFSELRHQIILSYGGGARE
ncbi:TPA: hypothetical protein I7784_22660 [Vibrio vulnificus]|nr:hypothetical protein [Vibrio vulnificus]